MEAIDPAYGTATLLLIAAGAVALLLFLIIKVKLHAFLALVLVSLLTALAAGIPVAMFRAHCPSASPTRSARWPCSSVSAS